MVTINYEDAFVVSNFYLVDMVEEMLYPASFVVDFVNQAKEIELEENPKGMVDAVNDMELAFRENQNLSEKVVPYHGSKAKQTFLFY